MRAWIILSMLFFCIQSYSQTTFNIRVEDNINTQLNSVHVVNDGYITSGWSSDTTDGYHFDLMIFNVNALGEIISTKRYGDSNRMFWGLENSYSESSGGFMHQSIGPRNDTSAVNLTWYNEFGDTLFTKDFRSSYLGQGTDQDYFITPVFSYLDIDSIAYAAMNIFDPISGNDAVLYKLDPQGHELWHYVHATLSDPDAIYAVVPDGDGVIYTLYHTANPDVAYGYYEMIKRDQFGEIIWSKDSRDFEERIWYPQSILLDNDSIVVCGASNTINPTLFGVASIHKIDTLGSLIWTSTFGDYNDYEWRQFTNVVQTTDGNYVCGGTWTSIPGTEEIPEGQVNADYDQFAHIVKFDRDNGAIVWERKYRWLETYHDNHTLNDMKATPDGGVIFCGEANDTYHFYDPPYQQGWVVKLDACGCLVPGCDETCAVGIEDENSTQTPIIKLGPNPAKDLLNVFVGQLSNFDRNISRITIFDQSGKELKSIPIKYDDTTYMVDVSSYPTGQYILQLQSNHHTHSSSKFEVVR